MKEYKNSWFVKLDKCPYCDGDLNVSSLSTRSEKDSIGNVIELSKVHTNRCRGNSQKKLGTLRIKTESLTVRNTKLLTYENQKVLV